MIEEDRQAVESAAPKVASALSSRPEPRRAPASVKAPPTTAPPPLAPALDSSWDAADFDTNGAETGFLFIPPDPHAAAGPDHLVNVVNVTLEWYDKAGNLEFRDSLRDFFTALLPETYTFDPKVIYDQYAGRFIVITLERVDPDRSRGYIAVSDDPDPNGTWFLAEFDSAIFIGSELSWADYPGLAIDEEIVYITANYFSFASNAFQGVRVLAIDKGLGSGGLYDGGAGTGTFSDPYGGAGIATTTQPAHVFGSAPAGIGTFLVSYSGLSNGFSEFLQVVRMDDPLSVTPTYTQDFVPLGNIENTGVALEDAPQIGSAVNIEVNDRRALNAVWRDNSLWMTATIRGGDVTGSVNETAATWWQVDTSNLAAPSVADQGIIDGEDIAPETYTFFPSIAVTSTGEVAIGFSASASSIFAGSYYTTRSPGDPAGSNSGSELLRAGTASYVRTFGGPRNRWGDYSGISVDPVDQCFWVYNEHAIAQGSPTGSETGRWGTAYGRACACDQSYAMPENLWKQISLACDQGSALTVADLFGDDLDATEYGLNWGMYAWDAATASYTFLSTTDTLAPGQGYWLATLLGSQTVDCKGVFNNEIEVPLEADPSGRFNMVGHPFEFDVCWADAEVIDSDGTTVLTLDQADPGGACLADPPGPGCILSRVAYKWTGAAYASFDGTTPGMQGTLEPFDGFWVKAYKDGIQLRVPAIEGSSCTTTGAPAATSRQAQASSSTSRVRPGFRPRSWHVRLIATSGQLQDDSAVLGRMAGSRPGYDRHDLPKLSPFGAHYLSVVFPRADWPDRPGEYASDFRPRAMGPDRGTWAFEVRTSAIGEEITLTWEGPGNRLSRAILVDQSTGESIRVDPAGSYTYTADSGSRSFYWMQTP